MGFRSGQWDEAYLACLYKLMQACFYFACVKGRQSSTMVLRLCLELPSIPLEMITPLKIKMVSIYTTIIHPSFEVKSIILINEAES